MMDFKRNYVTIIFVSHSMGVVEMLCDRGIWIDEHVIRMSGETKEVVKGLEKAGHNAELLRDVKGNL